MKMFAVCTHACMHATKPKGMNQNYLKGYKWFSATTTTTATKQRYCKKNKIAKLFIQMACIEKFLSWHCSRSLLISFFWRVSRNRPFRSRIVFFLGKIKRKNVFALWLSWIACSYSTNQKKNFRFHCISYSYENWLNTKMYFILFALISKCFFSLHHLFRAEKCEVTLLLAFHCIRYLITFWRFCFVCFFFECVSWFFWVLACTYVCRYLNRLNCAMHCAYAPKSHLHYICAI